jgi:hypothetical protein
MMNSKSIALLVDRCAAVGSPCQATNLQAPAPDASPAVQLSPTCHAAARGTGASAGDGDGVSLAHL